MFSMIKNFGRPFMVIGRKFNQIFRLGRKAEPVVSDIRNLQQFENLAPSGLRQRSEKPSDIYGPNKEFYGNMAGYLNAFKYPV